MSAPMTLEDLLALLEELFPVEGGLSSMELGSPPAVCRMPAGPRESEDSLRLTLRLVSWDRDAESGERKIRDIKEQQLYVGPASLMRHGGRLAAFLRGSCAALKTLFEAGADTETLMPHDLWRYGVLKLVKAQSADDFHRALLVRSRLGRYLPR
jgi:hypothetical protein